MSEPKTLSRRDALGLLGFGGLTTVLFCGVAASVDGVTTQELHNENFMPSLYDNIRALYEEASNLTPKQKDAYAKALTDDLASLVDYDFGDAVRDTMFSSITHGAAALVVRASENIRSQYANAAGFHLLDRIMGMILNSTPTDSEKEYLQKYLQVLTTKHSLPENQYEKLQRTVLDAIYDKNITGYSNSSTILLLALLGGTAIGQHQDALSKPSPS